jgi:SAM-dependent methyltransferase
VDGLKAFRRYGKYYDMLYKDKDYEGECDFLEVVFRKYGDVPSSILDAGCGTGGHAVVLAQRGYEVTGIDQSEIMIDIAQEKAAQQGVDADFLAMNIIDFKLEKKFDACISMFATINYVTTNEELQTCLGSISRHLKPGALFIFDYWNGPAVLTLKPSIRVKTVESNGMRLIRIATPSLDAVHHLCRVSYDCVVLEGRRLIDEFKEEHVVRFLFPEEVRHYLEENGFDLLGIFPFLDLDGRIDETVWNAVAVAKAR